MVYESKEIPNSLSLAFQPSIWSWEPFVDMSPNGFILERMYQYRNDEVPWQAIGRFLTIYLASWLKPRDLPAASHWLILGSDSSWGPPLCFFHTISLDSRQQRFMYYCIPESEDEAIQWRCHLFNLSLFYTVFSIPWDVCLHQILDSLFLEKRLTSKTVLGAVTDTWTYLHICGLPRHILPYDKGSRKGWVGEVKGHQKEKCSAPTD